jgi:uncharacterized membrane protein YccC
MNNTNHFNQLSEAEAERLAILAEECGEVIQAVGKVLRHGYESNNKGQLPETNRQALEREIGDLLHNLARMEVAGDLSHDRIEARALSKAAHVGPYLHHQGGAA